MARTNAELSELELVKYAGKFSVPTASASTVLELQSSGNVVLVDVRSDEEINVSRLPGAITQAEFERLDKSAYAGKTIVPYCTIGYRSGQYATKLLAAGGLGEGCQVLNGEGVVPWTHKSGGRPLVDHLGNETMKVHVYGPTWDLVDDRYTSITEFTGVKSKLMSKAATFFL